MRNFKNSALSILALFALLSINSCKDKEEDQVEEEVEQLSPNVHVAFAGGGWRAHTGHSAFIMGLLENGERSLSSAFSNVQTISSNSGGSWFSTMLMYSNAFNTDIQAANAATNWGSTGWLGKQIQLFGAVDDCLLDSSLLYTYCVLKHYGGGLHWKNAVENLVFNGYNLGATTLGDPKLSWADQKTLLLQTSIMTSNAVLNGSFVGEKAYYQACYGDSNPNLTGWERSTCDPAISAIASPATFWSLPSGSSLTSPVFLPQIGTGTNAQNFNLGYTENAIIDYPKLYTSISNPIKTSGVPVMSAAASSSAAVGFLGSDNMLSAWPAAYELRDLAVSFSLANQQVTDMDIDSQSLTTLKDEIAVRLADGGTVDNSAVAQLVAHLQNNDEDGFNIVAFDIVTEKFPSQTNPVSYEVGMDIAHLFGFGVCPGPSFCVGDNCGKPCYDTVSAQVFTQDSFLNTPSSWEHNGNDPKFEHKIIYTKYTVTTVENSAFGVKAGSTGTLHAFSCIYGDAGTEPTADPSKGGFDAYQAMLNFVYDAVTNQGGLQHLEDAFQISNN